MLESLISVSAYGNLGPGDTDPGVPFRSFSPKKTGRGGGDGRNPHRRCETAPHDAIPLNVGPKPASKPVVVSDEPVPPNLEVFLYRCEDDSFVRKTEMIDMRAEYMRTFNVGVNKFYASLTPPDDFKLSCVVGGTDTDEGKPVCDPARMREVTELLGDALSDIFGTEYHETSCINGTHNRGALVMLALDHETWGELSDDEYNLDATLPTPLEDQALSILKKWFYKFQSAIAAVESLRGSCLPINPPPDPTASSYGKQN